MRDSHMRRRQFLTTLGAAGASAMLIPLSATSASARPERAATSARAKVTALIGSYTSSNPPGHGLNIAHRTSAGALRPAGEVDGVPDVSWLAWHPDHQHLYVTNEREQGSLTALDVNGHVPKVINAVPSGGAAPTHATVHPEREYLLAANYGDGTVAVHRINDDYSIGDRTDLVRHEGANRQAHAHQVVVDPSGAWVVAVDLGADSVYVYGLDANSGKLTQNQQLRMPAGNGPRHLAFHPNAAHAYLLSELKSVITVLAWDHKAGRFTPGQVIGTRERDAGGENFPAEIALDRDGRFVYASNRGDDTIATLTVSDDGAKLSFVGTTPVGGVWPRHFTLDPEEESVYVANQKSGTINRLTRDVDTGRLAVTQDSVRYPSVAMLTFQA